MRVVSAMSLSSGGRLRLACGALLAACVLGLAGARQAAADTSSYVQSAAPLNFPSDSPAENANWFLYDTACDTSHSCEAVGYYTDPAGHQQAYVEQILDGIPGPAAKIQLPADANPNPSATLYGVSCGSSDDCEAYGTYETTVNSATVLVPIVVQITDGVPAAAVELRQSLDSRGPSEFSLDAISCYSSSACVAVGQASSDDDPFVLPIVDGVPQSIQVPRLPGDANPAVNAAFAGVACQPGGSCVAVGSYLNAAGDSAGLVLPIDDGVAGVGATADPADAAANPDASLDHVACPATGTCEATGSYYTAAAVYEDYVVPITDGAPGAATGFLSPSSVGANSSVSVEGLSCSSASLCVAAGYDTGASANALPVLVRITGSTASATQPVLPSNADTTTPEAAFYTDGYANVVGCVPSGPCLAGGYYDTAPNYSAAAGFSQAVGADGVIGSAVPAPAPADISPSGPEGHGSEATPTFGTGCVDTGSCVSTGEYYDNDNLDEPYVISLQAPLIVSSSSLAAAGQGVPYQATLAATGAWGSYSWSLASGSLPAGLGLNAQSGVISGTPSGSGSSTFTVEVKGTGSPQQTATAQLTLAVAASPPSSTSTSATTTTTPTTTTTTTPTTTTTTTPTTTTSAGTPTPTTQAVPVVKLLGSSSKLTGDRLRVRLNCAGASCRGTVKLTSSDSVTVRHGKKRDRKIVRAVIGQARFSAAVGSSAAVGVTLNGTGRRLLRDAEHQRLAVVILAAAAGGNTASRRETIYSAMSR